MLRHRRGGGGLLRQDACGADLRRMRPAGGPAQCAVRLLAPFQPGAGAQALAGGAGPDGLLQKAHKDPGQRAAG